MASVSDVGKDVADPQSYDRVKWSGKNLTRGKFHKRSGRSSFSRWLRESKRSNGNVETVEALMSEHPLNNPCTLAEFETSLYEVHLSENVVRVLDSMYVVFERKREMSIISLSISSPKSK